MPTCNSTESETHWATDNVVGNLSLHSIGWISCALCAVIASSFSFYLIWRHAANYTNPKEQRHIVRILLMIPIYAVTSTFSYLWYWHALYWEFGRDCYEAFAIAAFFALMCQYIAPTLSEQKEFFATMTVQAWPWPANWVNWCYKKKTIWRTPTNGLTWFNVIWFCVFQYCFIRVAMTVTSTVTQYFGDYCEESYNPAFAHFWTVSFNMISVTVAMYCLVAFYLNLKTELAPKKPLLKLLCIKLVIFFSFWQMILLDFLATLEIIKPNNILSPGDINVGLCSMAICVEMIIFSVMHLFAFPWKVYADPQVLYKTPPPGVFKALLDAFNPLDTIRAIGRGVRWVVVGHKRRHAQAEEIVRRKESRKYPGGYPSGAATEDSEGMGLVANAGAMGELAQPQGSYELHEPGGGGLTVAHPAPTDQQTIRPISVDSIPEYGYVSFSQQQNYQPYVQQTQPPTPSWQQTTHPSSPGMAPPRQRPRPSSPGIITSGGTHTLQQPRYPSPSPNSSGSSPQLGYQQQFQFSPTNTGALPYPSESALPSPSPYTGYPDSPQLAGDAGGGGGYERANLLSAQQQSPLQQQQGSASFTYNDSASQIGADGVYTGPSPRRKQQDGDDPAWI